MKKRIVAGVLLAFSFGASRIVYRFYLSESLVPDTTHIRPYEPEDYSHITKIFSENFYALTANPDFDIDLMLTKQTPNKYERKYFGKLNTAVFLQDAVPVGFVSYYMRSSHKGLVLFLAVDEAYRGKGFSKKLLQYAMYQLKQMGATVIKIATRSENNIAQNIYSKFFKKEYEQDGFVHYRKDT